jgi:hypothetical protein
MTILSKPKTLPHLPSGNHAIAACTIKTSWRQTPLDSWRIVSGGGAATKRLETNANQALLTAA